VKWRARRSRRRRSAAAASRRASSRSARGAGVEQQVALALHRGAEAARPPEALLHRVVVEHGDAEVLLQRPEPLREDGELSGVHELVHERAGEVAVPVRGPRALSGSRRQIASAAIVTKGVESEGRSEVNAVAAGSSSRPSGSRTRPSCGAATAWSAVPSKSSGGPRPAAPRPARAGRCTARRRGG
jgi:hypothetical protein